MKEVTVTKQLNDLIILQLTKQNPAFLLIKGQKNPRSVETEPINTLPLPIFPWILVR